MNILVTGGAGFIGSHLCRRLLAEGNFVICVDNFITSSQENIKDLLAQGKFRFINHDITQPLFLDEELDWILHFASPASPKDYLEHPIKTIKVGALGTHNCLGIAKAKSAKFLLASTSEIYGDPLVHPQPEEYFGNVNPVGPRSCYDEAKRAAEAMTFAYWRQHNLDIRVIRIFNTYGPQMRLDDGRVVSNFIYQALSNKDITIYGDGFQTRSFCYIDDLIEGIIKFMQVDYSGPVNLGNPAEITIQELVKTIVVLTGSRSKIKFMPLPQDDPKKRQPDINRAKKILRWQPKISLEDGLKLTIAAFQTRIGTEGQLR